MLENFNVTSDIFDENIRKMRRIVSEHAPDEKDVLESLIQFARVGERCIVEATSYKRKQELIATKEGEKHADD